MHRVRSVRTSSRPERKKRAWWMTIYTLTHCFSEATRRAGEAGFGQLYLVRSNNENLRTKTVFGFALTETAAFSFNSPIYGFTFPYLSICPCNILSAHLLCPYACTVPSRISVVLLLDHALNDCLSLSYARLLATMRIALN